MHHSSLVGMASLGSKMFLLFIFLPKFPFRSWTIVHGGQKIELAQKIKQVEVDEKCMQANFGRHGLSSFEDFTHFSFAFKMAKFPFQTMGYNNPVGVKK